MNNQAPDQPQWASQLWDQAGDWYALRYQAEDEAPLIMKWCGDSWIHCGAEAQAAAVFVWRASQELATLEAPAANLYQANRALKNVLELAVDWTNNHAEHSAKGRAGAAVINAIAGRK